MLLLLSKDHSFENCQRAINSLEELQQDEGFEVFILQPFSPTTHCCLLRAKCREARGQGILSNAVYKDQSSREQSRAEKSGE